ncbi:Mitochondrial distribution and morphology protein 10 [Dimargaris cristalligena]|nr:Mitochondrial distribution and morphology protein 10 [Dimargaris cristalligena]
MHDFMPYCLRQFNRSSRWNDDNQYSNLSAASRSILDFTPPAGFTFYVSKAPSSFFKSSYRLQTFPLFSGSLGYLFTSEELDLRRTYCGNQEPATEDAASSTAAGTASNSTPAFAGSPSSTNVNDSLLSQFHNQAPAPSDSSAVLKGLLGTCQVGAWNPVLFSPPQDPFTNQALYSRRFTRRTQFLAASAQHRDPANNELLAQLQYDCSKWCTELSYTFPGSLVGWRGLYNFGPVPENPTLEDQRAHPGRVSIGGELYFSTADNNGGLSVGARYRTLVPQTAEFTCVTNPVMGHLSTAYTMSITPRCIMSSRFDFNFYSLFSDLAAGIEWQSSEESLIKASVNTSQGVVLGFDCRYRKILLSVGATLSHDSFKRGRRDGRMPADLSMPHGSPLKSLGIHVQFFS